MTRSPSSFTMLLSRHTRRREFIAGLGGAAVWPVVGRTQPAERVRRIGVLSTFGPDGPEGQKRNTVFEQTLEQLGWAVGRDLKIETRQVGGDLDRLRRYAAELVALAPDVIVSIGSLSVAPLQQATRSIPIVFLSVADPVGAGFVQSMGHPGGNITGFLNFEYSMSGKWAELLKQMAPNVTRALVFRDPTSAAGIGQFAAIRSVAQSLGVELTPVNVRDNDEIEANVAAFARSGNGGVIVTAGGTAVHREMIISLVARHKLPSVYPYRYYVADGGLISYGPNTLDPYRLRRTVRAKRARAAEMFPAARALRSDVVRRAASRGGTLRCAEARRVAYRDVDKSYASHRLS
jgi:putative tryptophan/tyrosine transport system substrate-binding protein